MLPAPSYVCDLKLAIGKFKRNRASFTIFAIFSPVDLSLA